MSKEYFVDIQSVVRQIWGKSDTILFIFAGASADFALNKAVEWRYFTGRRPLSQHGEWEVCPYLISTGVPRSPE